MHTHFETAFETLLKTPHGSYHVGTMTPQQTAAAVAAGLRVRGEFLLGSGEGEPTYGRAYHWGALNGGGMGHNVL